MLVVAAILVAELLDQIALFQLKLAKHSAGCSSGNSGCRPRSGETSSRWIDAAQLSAECPLRQKLRFGDASKLRGSGTLSRHAARARKPAARDDAADVARYFC
jgi:hypothetical protein